VEENIEENGKRGRRRRGGGGEEEEHGKYRPLIKAICL
jgi:hypothetical protein